ncbi:sigma-70 family RNA polymerase sigma factor [Streptomyces sp. NPDC026673]|uniref:sigma-70 family RNA polymerase sigma factor n=1 Tax=Streptomyces sp. NPDC026673 TaxID=3155724 RepID=UPI0033D3DC2F
MGPDPSPPAHSCDDAHAIFTQLRPRLFGIAYRVLGSAADAEDVVREVWLRWQRTDRSAVLNPSAHLASTATRLAIDTARSAHANRRSYIGPWLPEPIDTGTDAEAGSREAETESLELALLLALERLTPTERAAYVLREAFGYPYPQIAEILQLGLGDAHQIVRRAREYLLLETRGTPDPAELRHLVESLHGSRPEGLHRYLGGPPHP